MSFRNRAALLDVNALIALFDRAHIHHEAAHLWVSQLEGRGWRTCPLVENGLLRIMGNPGYKNGFVPVRELAVMLERTKERIIGHEFWGDSFSFSRWVARAQVEAPSLKITDAYLLKLAAMNGGTLATFDSGIRPEIIGERDSDIVEHIAF